MVKIEQTDPFSQCKRTRLDVKCITPEDRAGPNSAGLPLSQIASLPCCADEGSRSPSRSTGYGRPVSFGTSGQTAGALKGWLNAFDWPCSKSRALRHLLLTLLRVQLKEGMEDEEKQKGPKQVALQWENLERGKHVRPHPAALSSTNILFMHTSDWTSYPRLITAHHRWHRPPASVPSQGMPFLRRTWTEHQN